MRTFPKKQARVNLIGFGRMGMRHYAVLQKLKITKVAIVDKKSAFRNGNIKGSVGPFFKSSKKAFLRHFPNFTIVSTTADSHFKYVCEAALMGVKYILCEKPMAISLEQCRKMISLCYKSGSLLSINHQMRFMPIYMKIKKYLNTSKFGGLSCMTVTAGNFGIAMNGTHYFEAFRFLSDEKPWRVMAWLDRKAIPNPRGKKFKDRSGCVIVETKSGKRLILQCSVGQGHGIQVTYAARNGWITVDELNGRVQASVRRANFRAEPTTKYALPSRNWSEIIKPAEILDSTAAVIRALLKDNNRVTGEDGLLAMKVLVAAHMSAERGGRPIFINGRLDLRRKFAWA